MLFGPLTIESLRHGIHSLLFTTALRLTVHIVPLCLPQFVWLGLEQEAGNLPAAHVMPYHHGVDILELQASHVSLSSGDTLL